MQQHGVYKYVVSGSVAMLMGIAALPANAQSDVRGDILLARGDGVVLQSERTAATLKTLVSVRIEQRSTEQAITAVEQAAGTVITYNKASLPTNTRVTLIEDKISLSDALARILRGTALVLQQHASGRLMLVARQNATQGTIIGIVTRAKTRHPIAGARIHVGNMSESIVTDSAGRFRISVPAGEHTLRVRAVGFGAYTGSVTVSEDASVTVDIALEPSANVLDQVIVTGTVVATERKAIATPITVISAEEIERRGITRIEELFRGEVPGVLALERGSDVYGDDVPGKMVTSSVFTRGSSGTSLSGVASPLKTFIDGVELLDASYLGTIDPRSIERVEIITGPQAATIYGSGAMGGVMQIFTKQGNGTRSFDVSLSLKYGILQSNLNEGLTPTHNHGVTLRGGSGPEFSYAASGSYNYSGQWQPGLFNRSFGGSLGVTHVRGPVTANGNVSVTNGRNGTTGNNGALRHRQLMESGEWWQDNFPPSNHITRRISMSNSQMIALNLDYRLTAFWQHHMTLGKANTNFTIVPEYPAFQRPADTLYQETQTSGNRTTFNYNTTFSVSPLPSISSVLTLGLNGSRGTQLNTNGCTARSSETSWTACSSSGYGLSVDRALDDKSWGGFGSVRVGLFEQLYLTMGIRGEQNPTYGQRHRTDWTPTSGIAYTFQHHELSLKMQGSYGRATRPPAPDRRLEFYSTPSPYYDPAIYLSRFSNPHLTPEYSRGPQGGIELYYGNVGSLTVNHYQQTVTDLIQNVKVDSILRTYVSTGEEIWQGQFQYQNVAKVRQYGWEATGTANIRSFSFKGTYSWADSKVIASSSASFIPGTSFLFLPTHSGSVTIGYSLRGTSISAVTNFVGTSLVRGEHTWFRREYANGRIRNYISRRLDDYISASISRAGYAKSDLSVSQRINPWLAATVNIKNLGNSFGSEVDMMRPVLGRQTAVGFTIRKQ